VTLPGFGGPRRSSQAMIITILLLLLIITITIITKGHSRKNK
jgi:hypothetical protein